MLAMQLDRRHLDWQRRPGRRLAVDNCGVCFCQLALHERCRPAVGDGVVHVGQQHMQLWAERHQLRTTNALCVGSEDDGSKAGEARMIYEHVYMCHANESAVTVTASRRAYSKSTFRFAGGPDSRLKGWLMKAASRLYSADSVRGR